MNSQTCLVCGATATFLDAVDFNKSCEEHKGQYLPVAGIPIHYLLCDTCGFCFSPEICGWSIDDFAARIYNSEYVTVDPDYIDKRPRENSQTLKSAFAGHKSAIRHLDYGGGEGLLSRLLLDDGFDSTSYDPYVDQGTRQEKLGKFNLITAFEVFEHVPSVDQLRKDLLSLLADDGIILFTTQLSDGHVKRHERLTWWYAAPRNGHICLYSRKSLLFIAKQEKLGFCSFSDGFHALWRSVPGWASHIME